MLSDEFGGSIWDLSAYNIMTKEQFDDLASDKKWFSLPSQRECQAGEFKLLSIQLAFFRSSY